MGASKVEHGITLQGEYELLECLGERTGLVFHAKRRRDGAALIVRVFAGLDAQSRVRVLEAATRAIRVRHPSLAAVSACGTNDDDDVFVVEELVSGRSLAELCERGGIPPLSRSVDIALQLCRALESAHRHGVAHDALCPRNVLLSNAVEASTRLQVKLVDLGVPGFLRPWPRALASALYMAPEQLAKHRIGRSLDAATPVMNVYSVGALLYDLCTGGPPFAASSVDELAEAHAVEPLMPPSRINPQIPSTLDTTLLRALSKNPAQRFASMSELIEALSGLRLTTGVSGVQPVFVNSSAEPARASQSEGATFHGNFEERPTSKTELPPRAAAESATRIGEELTERWQQRVARASDEPTRPSFPRLSPPPLGSFSSAPSQTSPELPPPAGRSEVPAPVGRAEVPAPVARAALPPPVPRSELPPPAPRSELPPPAPRSELPPPVPRSELPPARRSQPPVAQPFAQPAASIDLLRTSQPPHQRLAEALAALPRQLNLALHGRDRFLPIGLLVACVAGALLFWQAARLPQPQERVRTISLGADPDRAPERRSGDWATSERARSQAQEQLQAVARVAPPSAHGANGSGTERYGERAAPPTRDARAPRAVSRAASHTAHPSEARPQPPPTIEPTREALEVVTPQAALEPEPSRAADAAIPLAARTTPIGSEPAPHAIGPAGGRPAEVASAAAPSVPAPRATPIAAARPVSAHIVGLSVRGSLPSSNVVQGIERIIPQLNGCQRAAGTAPSAARALALRVAFELDEQGRARNPRVAGPGSPALLACVSAVTARIASRRAPDTGTVAASFQLVFGP